jgi:heat shock protein HtpX
MAGGFLSASGLRTHIWNNNLKSVLLLAGFPFLLVAIGFALSLLWNAGSAEFQAEFNASYNGASGAAPGLDAHFQQGLRNLPQTGVISLGVAGIWFLIAWFFHQAMIDASMGARKVDRKDEPQLYNLLENLTISRGMTMPHLRVIETGAMNAYASGLRESQYTVTVTRGLMEALNAEELEAVLAHELSHIRHRDVRLLVISVIFVGIISFAFEVALRGFFRGLIFRSGGSRRGGGGNAAILMVIVFAILAVAYGLAILIRFALSRRREYMADAGAVELTKNPDAMVSALEKISGRAAIEKAPEEMREMFIENPKQGAGVMGMFMTHPPIEKRIEALRDYAGASPAQTSVPQI